MSDRQDEKLKQLVEAFLKSEQVSDAGRNALALLFPKIRPFVAGEAAFFLEESRRDQAKRNRASSQHSVRHYFDLNPKGAALGQSELDSLLTNPSPAESFETFLKRVERLEESERGRLRRLFLEALDGAFGPDRPFNALWLEAIVNASPYFISNKDEEPKLLFHIDNSQRLKWLIISGIKTVPIQDRAGLIMDVTRTARDISLLCSVFRGLVGDLRQDGANADKAESWFGGDVEKIRSVLVERVRELMRTGKIFQQADVAAIMWFMWGANLGEEILAYNSGAVEQDLYLPILLDIPVRLARSTAGDYEYIDRKSWSAIVDLDLLKKRATDILKHSADVERQRLARRFLDALAKKEDPESDDQI